MGQGQSTGQNQSSTESSTPKKCYYELLGVPMHATGDEIKKAYRKKALELHPDRNYGNTDDATQLFAEVQIAYEVLSNPHERAWYDSHRQEILETGSGAAEDHYEYNVRMTTAEDITRMYMDFDGKLKFDDSSDGFFTSLKDFFDRLAKEEIISCEREEELPPVFPTFGKSTDSHESIVRPFYSVWSSFSTRKTFAWKNMYRLSEAPDRRTRRLMEKENKKAREQGIRDFNNAVRALVSFVKRRDPRQVPIPQSGADLNDSLRAQAASQAARARAANQAAAEEYVAPSWAHTENDKNGDSMYESEAEDEDEDNEEEYFECVVCRKMFKSESQYMAHEQSKKHRKAVYQLERTMKKENAALGLDMTGEGSNTLEEGFVESNGEEIHITLSKADSSASEDRTGHISSQTEHNGKDISPSQLSENTEDNSSHSEKRISSKEAETSAFIHVASHSDSEQSLSSCLQAQTLDKNDNLVVSDPTLSDLETPQRPRIGAAKLKRAKKEARKAASKELENKCVVCGTIFSSRTKLFDHIKKEGHARAPSTATKGKKAQ